MRFKDHFSGSSSRYAAFRPRYPATFVAEIAALCGRHDLAWDCATGNGQAAHLLAEHFQRVVATDASAQQIANALHHERVEYRVGDESQSSLADATADLVTVATALRWLNFDVFYEEVRRVLKPGGVIAAWTYGSCVLDDDLQPVVARFEHERLIAYWPPERRLLLEGYRTIPFPFGVISLAPHAIELPLTLQEFLGYIGTWSAVAIARKEEGADVVSELRNELSRHWSPSESRVVRWPLYARVGRR